MSLNDPSTLTGGISLVAVIGLVIKYLLSENRRLQKLNDSLTEKALGVAVASNIIIEDCKNALSDFHADRADMQCKHNPNNERSE